MLGRNSFGVRSVTGSCKAAVRAWSRRTPAGRVATTPHLRQVFGMAEGLLSSTRLDDPPDLVDHTQGRPLCAADELRVVDGDGRPVPPGIEDELLVRGSYKSTY